MKKYCFFLFAFASFCSYGQDIALPEIVPPSPTAYELGKYGQIPVGMFTGTPNVSLPLYTYSTRNLSVPISLSYSSNGIKVDQLASNVGLGWSLNVGGVITRIVRDKPDEERGVLIPDHEIHEVGFHTPEVMDFLYASGEEDVDTETDLYMYNFMGHSGKFVFDNRRILNEGDNGIIMMPQNDLKVDVINGGFSVTTSDGVIYSFQSQEKTSSRIYGAGHSLPEIPAVSAWYLSNIQHPKGDIINFTYDDEANTIMYDISVSDALSVSIPYFQDTCDGYMSGIQNVNSITTKYKITRQRRLNKISSNISENGEILFESNVSHPEISSLKLLSKIMVKDKFTNTKEQFDFNYDPTLNDKILLDKVQFLDPNKSYWFEYYNPDQIPARLSKSVDYYGYFNGKNNDSKYRFPKTDSSILNGYIDPQFLYYSLGDDGSDKSIDPTKAQNGLLKKVHYPTKGYNEFEYEANTYQEEVTVYPNLHNITIPLSAISEEGVGPQLPPVEDIGQTGEIVFDQMVDFTLIVGPPYDPQTTCPNPPTHTPTARITITDDQNNDISISMRTNAGRVLVDWNTFLFIDGSPSINNQYSVEFKKGRTYTIKLSSFRKCVETYTNFTYRTSDTPYNEFQNINTGGLRIKKVKSFDTSTSVNPNNSMRYYYGKKDSPNVSSGQKGSHPFYITNSENRTACGSAGEYRHVTSQSLNSNSVRQLYSSSDSGTTTYKYVTVSYGGDNFEGGGTENEYYIMPDVQGNPLRGDPIEGSPWVNMGWKNGLLKKEMVFKKNNSTFIPLKETINSYKSVDSVFSKVYGYTVNKMFEFASPVDITYECTADDVTRQTKHWYCKTDHKHLWLIHDNPFLPNTPGMNCLAPGHDMDWFMLSNPCYGEAIGHIILYPDMLDNLNIMEYTNNSYWFYQDSSTVKEYDDNGNFTQTATNYYYDNPQHLQQTRVERTTSTDDKKLIIQTDYADDLGIQPLIDDYRIAEPVQVRSYKKEGSNTEEILSTQLTEYAQFGSLYLPKFIKTLKGNGPSNQMQNRIEYHSYDGYGNLREVSQINGTRIVYVMGYDFTLPVAKLENVTLSEINQSWLNAIYNAGNESALITALDNLRDNITGPNKAALVTTLTYKPLVGVHTVTDPKGYKMTYEYDDFGRLKYVKDMDDKILSENQYHYITD